MILEKQTPDKFCPNRGNNGISIDRAELLMKEYELVTNQIIHWDTFFWSKSNFFLTIESVLLAVVVTQLYSELNNNTHMTMILFILGIFVTVFNLVLCYVWFRTNRSNHEYLKVRFERALKIEDDLALGGVVQTYRLQRELLEMPKYIKHSSSWWEINLPIIFMIAWFMSLIMMAFDSYSSINAILTSLTIVSVVSAIIFIERTGWPRPKREKIDQMDYDKR
jgi:hypothetical protein